MGAFLSGVSGGKETYRVSVLVIVIVVSLLVVVVRFQFRRHDQRDARYQEGLQEEPIKSYQAELRVQSDGEVVITEFISAKAAGKRIRRGLVRALPPAFVDRADIEHPLEYRLRFARRGQQGLSLTPRKNSSGMIELFLGDASLKLKSGEYDYQLQYVVKRLMSSVQDRRELKWHVTGAWQLLIEKATAVVILPPQVDPKKLYYYAEVQQGAAAEGTPPWRKAMRKVANAAAVIETAADALPGRTITQVRAASPRPLLPGEELVVFVSWPEQP